jgi:hypothetical protein
LSAISLTWRILFFSLLEKQKKAVSANYSRKTTFFFLPCFVSWNALDAKGTKDKKESSSIGHM